VACDWCVRCDAGIRCDHGDPSVFSGYPRALVRPEPIDPTFDRASDLEDCPPPDPTVVDDQAPGQPSTIDVPQVEPRRTLRHDRPRDPLGLGQHWTPARRDRAPRRLDRA